MAGPSTASIHTLGVVSFLNARPLWEFLSGRPGFIIKPAVPSRLAGMLADGLCDIALLPLVDYWRARHRLARISDACIASEGETLTVRVFSRVPADHIQRLHVDGDSHTSVVLAQVLWLEMYQRRLEVIPWQATSTGSGLGPLPADLEALLLIGDKVIHGPPGGFELEIDLGTAWKALTGLPFVFAAWYAGRGRDYTAVGRMLEEARDAGVAVAERIALREGPQRGWPVEVAVRYLRDHMRYTLTDAMRSGMDRFFSLIDKHGLPT
jgi:chorismate dehydratase